MGAYGNALTIKNLVRQGQMQDMQMQDYTANRDIDRAAKRVDLRARAAMLVYAAPEDQKQQVWSAERQRFIGTGLVSPNEIPEMYPGEQALQGWIAAAQSPERRMELIEKIAAGALNCRPWKRAGPPLRRKNSLKRRPLVAPGDLTARPFRSANS